MEPFKVICVTCQAKLSVRNEKLIGQILACPRCGSMVEVARPAAAAAAAVIASTESTINLTARQIKEINEQTSEAAPEPQPTASETNTPEPTASQPTASQANAPQVFADAPPAPAQPVPTEVLQASAEVAKYKIITWSVASFVIGATLVGAIVYKRGSSSDEQPAATTMAEATPGDDLASPATTPAHEEVIKAIGEEVEDFATEPSLPTESIVETASTAESTIHEPSPRSDSLSNGSPEELTPEQPPVATEEALTAQPAPRPIEVPEPIEPDSSADQSDEPPTLTVEPAEPRTRRFNPLQFDLASLSLDKLDQPREPETQAIDPPLEEVPDEPVAADLEAGETDDEESLEDMADSSLAVRRGPATDSELNTRAADEQLKLLVPAVEFRDQPLLDALRLVSQLSGQPVSVAPEQLLMAGITSQKKVSLKGADISLQKVLEQLLDPLQLEYQTDGPQIVVRRKEASKLREIKYPIDDLVSDRLSAEQLASWVEQLVAPTTWQSAGGNGRLQTSPDSLRITQPQHVQYQVLILLERMRLAQQLTPRSRYPVKQLVGSPAPAQLEAKLSASTTFTFTQLTPIGQVFAHWQTELDAPLLVDWPALAEAGVFPDTPVACAIHDQPWQVALEEVLPQLGLGYRAVTGGAIEVTSATKASHQLQVELFRVPSLRQAQLAKLQELAQEHSTNQAAALIYDPATGTLLASQPATAMRALYGELRAERLVEVR